MTLAQEVANIVKKNTSLAEKDRALVKLGITPYERSLILGGCKGCTSSGYTFGVEIECLVRRDLLVAEAEKENVYVRYESYNHRSKGSYFKFVTDASIRGENGIECVSPVLRKRGGMPVLERMCKALNDAGARVNSSTGLHVHIGAKGLTEEAYINVFRNYQMLEGAIDKFMARSRRENANRYCISMQNFNLSGARSKQDVADIIRTRYTKVNAMALYRHQTIEFRQHQGTTDFKKISMWVKFCAKLVEFSKSNVLTERVENIQDIPFITATEKRYFLSRSQALA